MPLEAGARLGPYEIVAPIGAGGMGEVYRARDTRLDRTVAIKVLPESLAVDPQLRERFDREARAISALNHPHICTLHDVGHQEGVDFLVLEYLDGETLAQRIARSPVPAIEAQAIAVDVADALAAAHRAGVIHRDLKPANVMLTKTGAKLLDFGLAKNAAPVIATSGLSMAPTTPPNLTAQGTILGTFQYMAPEQIEGLDADARTDIFAFGAVLFEMLTGRPAFESKTRAQLLGAILKDEPPPVSSLALSSSKGELDARGSTLRQAQGSPRAMALDRIVSTCLAKDPEDRWQTARDLLRELKWVTAEGSAIDVGPPKGGPHGQHERTWGPASAGPALAIAGVLTIALIATGTLALRHLRETPPAAETYQFTIAPPGNALFGGPVGGGTGAATQLAISPDGRSVALVARTSGKYTLWLRSLGALDVRQLPGTDDASFPFWSPDSRFIAFFAGGKLKKLQVAGGPAVVLCDANQGRGGAWNSDNVIIFGLPNTPLQRVSSAGGTPVNAAQLDKSYGETSHRWPQFLPDGHHFFFTAVTGAAGVATKPSVVKIGALDSTDAPRLFEAESSVAYADGNVLFLRGTSLMAQPFDAAARRFTADPFPVAEEVGTEGSRYTSFSVSRRGTLVYAKGGLAAGSRLTWFDRSGASLGDLGDLAGYLNLSIAPDGRRVATAIASGTPAASNIWTIDVARNVSSRLTFGPFEQMPVWSPDGARVAFLSLRAADAGIHQKAVNGTLEEEVVLKGQDPTIGSVPLPNDWSPDGRFLAYGFNSGSATGADIWILPLTGDKKPFALVQGPGPDGGASFSPDGRWIAYNGTDSGVPQVYVQPFPPTGGRFQVSKDSGTQPRWRGDGKELFFLSADGVVMSATIDTTREFQAGIPQRLFALFPTGSLVNVLNARQYAVTKDGKRFLLLVPRSSDRNASPLPLTVVVNWLAAVQK
jgi:Tol biopolymer transport system component